MKGALAVILLFCVYVYGDGITRKDAFELTKKGLTEYLKTGKRPAYMDFALKNYQLPYFFRTEPALFDSSSVCIVCELLVNALILERRMGMTNTQLAAEASYFCTILGIENERVCSGVIDLNIDIFGYIIDNNEDISGKKICGLILQQYECDDGGVFDWTIEIPEGQTIEKEKPTGTNTFNILQISDIHYDPLYTPGKSSSCGEPLCCQIDQVDAPDTENSCGYWGTYRDADIPLHTVLAALEHTATKQFDYVYYTGDFVSHRVWATSVQNNSRDIVRITEAFKEYYTVPVYPILGNHETHPVNVWSSEGETDESISTQWLFNLMADEWLEWLEDGAKDTILRGGYYTVSPRKGFRIIVLNSNVCYNENWWLLNESFDQYGQLAWLAQVLLEAEENKESVHILMHIPTGSGICLRSWSREYNKIVNRFANTITGQFNGHTHKDEFSIYYNRSDISQAINMVWNGASLTASPYVNPSYKLYEVDDETFDVLDYEEWIFNLTLANLNPEEEIEWYKLYSFKEGYGVDSLEPSVVDKLVHDMAKNHSLIEKYYNYKYRNTDPQNLIGCDEGCQKDILCEITITVSDEKDKCNELRSLYDESENV